MLNYAFANANGFTTYITDSTFVDTGAWVATGTYSPPLQVVEYDNARFIALANSINVPPLNNPAWSVLVLAGTVNPTDSFDIANTALALATEALNTIQGHISIPATYINYVGPPLSNPPVFANIVVDINGRQWMFYNGGWN